MSRGNSCYDFAEMYADIFEPLLSSPLTVPRLNVNFQVQYYLGHTKLSPVTKLLH